MTTTLSLTDDRDWLTLLEHLPEDYAELAVAHKQLQTQFGNAEITTADWLLRFVLLHVGADLPLLETVKQIAEAGGPRLSAMRLHMKMRRAAPYLHALIEQMVSWRTDAKPVLWSGYSLTSVDASSVRGPGAIGTDARVHVKLRLADACIADAVVTDAQGDETFERFTFAPDELVLGDRAHCNPADVVRATEHGADVLLRYARLSLPLRSAHSDRLDALSTVRALRDGGVLDLPVSFEHGDETRRGRFIATRLPVADAAEARNRLRRERGATVSADSLEAAGYMMLFTTVPRERMVAPKCLLAYRLRSQIEGQFRRWRSLSGFDRLPNYRDDTIIAWLYAKLLLGVLLERMSAGRRALSPPVQLAPIAAWSGGSRRQRAAAPGATAVFPEPCAVPDDDCGAASALSA